MAQIKITSMTSTNTVKMRSLKESQQNFTEGGWFVLTGSSTL